MLHISYSGTFDAFDLQTDNARRMMADFVINEIKELIAQSDFDLTSISSANNEHLPPNVVFAKLQFHLVPKKNDLPPNKA